MFPLTLNPHGKDPNAVSSNAKEDSMLGLASQKAWRRQETIPISAHNRINQIKEHPEIFSPLWKTFRGFF